MPLKKTPATRNAAQEELTPPEEFLDLAKRPGTGKKFTIRKNAAPETTPTRLMLGRTMNSKTCYTRDHTKKPNERSNVKLRGAPTLKPEQRATRDETHDLEMPRQGVSLLNAGLGFFFLSYLFFLFSQCECQQARENP